MVLSIHPIPSPWLRQNPYGNQQKQCHVVNDYSFVFIKQYVFVLFLNIFFAEAPMAVQIESNHADMDGWRLAGVVAIFDKADGDDTKSEVFMDYMKTQRGWRIARELRRLADQVEVEK